MTEAMIDGIKGGMANYSITGKMVRTRVYDEDGELLFDATGRLDANAINAALFAYRRGREDGFASGERNMQARLRALIGAAAAE